MHERRGGVGSGRGGDQGRLKAKSVSGHDDV